MNGEALWTHCFGPSLFLLPLVFFFLKRLRFDRFSPRNFLVQVNLEASPLQVRKCGNITVQINQVKGKL